MKVCRVRPFLDAVPTPQPVANAHFEQYRIPRRSIVHGRRVPAHLGTEIGLRRASAARDRHLRAQMTDATTTAVPERMWFANTGLRNFCTSKRAPADVSPFEHWLAAGRIFFPPPNGTYTELEAILLSMSMSSGHAIFAYEDQRGIVAVGHVREPRDVKTESGPTPLFPHARTDIHSLAVDWDTSVTRSMRDISSRTKVGGRPLQAIDATMALYPIALELLGELHARYRADPDAVEANVLARIDLQTGDDAPTRVQVCQARVGQGNFRAAVLAREPACRVTHVSMPACLVASHIKPWAVCVGGEHLDGANGLMLAPHVDFLFDTGRISFTDNGQLLLAPALDRMILRAWHIDEKQHVGSFSQDQALYLAFHRNYVFDQPRPRRQRNLVGDGPADAINAHHATRTLNVTPGVS
jgi:hypothetical protein